MMLFLHNLVFDQVILEKKSKLQKVYKRTDRQTDGLTEGRTTDNWRSENTILTFCLDELQMRRKNKQSFS